MWSAESRDEHDIPVRDEGSVTYSAAIESAATPDTASQRSEFSERVWREATRRRFTQVARPVVLGDGAPWIWNVADELFPQARQIVDRFHAQEHLSNLAKTLYGPADPRAPDLGQAATSRTRHGSVRRSAGCRPPPCLRL